jgi:hypothetical protein
LAYKDVSGSVAVVVLNPTAICVIVVPLNNIFPHTSQSPAVSARLVKSLGVPVVKVTGAPEAIELDITWPTVPALALSAAVVPITPPVVGLNAKLVAVAAPKVGVTKTGEVVKDIAPEPLTFAANAVPTPVPSPVIPAIGNPVALVNVPDDGVPRAPLNVTNAPAEPTFIPKAVATPVPKDVMPVPPFATAIVVPVQTPVVIVPNVVIDDWPT